MDPAISAAIIGGVVTGIPTISAVLRGNAYSRQLAREAASDARDAIDKAAAAAKAPVEQAQADSRSAKVRQQLREIKADLRSDDADVEMDAVDDSHELTLMVDRSPKSRRTSG